MDPTRHVTTNELIGIITDQARGERIDVVLFGYAPDLTDASQDRLHRITAVFHHKDSNQLRICFEPVHGEPPS